MPGPIDSDPNISLAAGTGAAAPGAGFSQLGGMVGTLNAINQNRQFQQAFAAKQKAGAILAAAPDLETGMTNLYKDPQVAAFAPEITSNIRQGMLAQTQQQGEVQKQAESGMSGVLRGIVASAGDPKAMTANVTTAFGTMSPQAQKIAQPYIANLVTSLTDGLDRNSDGSLTTAGTAQLKQRSAALATSVGISPTELQPAYGAPTTIDSGGQVNPGMTSLSSGAITPSGAPIGKTLAPAVTGSGQAVVGGGSGVNAIPGAPNALGVGGAAGGGGALPQPTGNALGVTPAMQAVVDNANAPAGGKAATAGAAAPVAPALPPATSALVPQHAGAATPTPQALQLAQTQGIPVAGDGKPLYTSPADLQSPLKFTTGTGGIPIMSDADKTLASAAAADYTGPGADRFKAAQGAMANFQTLNNDLDTLARGGGFLSPGSGGTVRAKIGTFLNTTAQMLGKELPIDPALGAAAESAMKETGRLGPQVLSQLTGQNHQAAQTIDEMTSTVPSINNTYMGGKLVLAGLQALAQRTIDERQFQAQWLQQPGNHGNLIGADVAFNAAHPAQDYAQGVLDKFGMNSNGFKTDTDVINAVHNGYLTPFQGGTIMHQQFPDKYSAPTNGGQ